MIDCTCKNCQKHFKAYLMSGKPKLFCCHQCRISYTKETRICGLCKKSFEITRSIKRTFCSQKCSNSFTWENRKKNIEKVSFHCEFCKKEFFLTIGRSKQRTPKFCSKSCYTKSSFYLKECEFCKREFRPSRSTTRFCSLKCGRENKKIHTYKNPGKWDENGYIVVYTKDGKGIKEHRKIMSEHLKRPLLHSEHVHHINGIKTDNRIENLQIISHSEHSRLHRIQEINSGKLPFGRSQNRNS